MLNELQTWWQDATPETRAAVWDIGIGFAAFLGGILSGAITGRILRSWNFDGAFGLTYSPPPGSESRGGFTPTRAVAMLVRLTVWAAAGWWFARRYDRPEIADTLSLVATRIWSLTALVTAALAIAGLLARRVVDCLQGPLPGWGGAGASRNGAADNRDTAGWVGAGVYALVVLFALLTAADAFDWPLTRTAAAALWQFVQQLFTAGAALLIAYLGATWARHLATSVGPVTPTQRAGMFTALALVGGTTVGAVATLLSGRGIVIGFLLVPVLGGLLWLARGYLPDVLAGLKLRWNKISQVWLDGAAWDVAGVGLLRAEIGRAGECGRVPNHLILEAAESGFPGAAARR
jgi:hypothetical protein